MKISSHPGFGVEIRDVDVRSLTDDECGQIRTAFSEHGLIFLRDQDLSPEEHIVFAERFGSININRFFAAHPSFPQVALVTKEPDQQVNIGAIWHTDHSYDTEPALGSILLAKEVPPQGGDTRFASMYRAYDRLSDGLKETIHSLSAVHSARHVFGSGAADVLTDPVHPMVITHPLSGKHALYVNPQFTLRIDGWSAEESAPLLNLLYETALVEEDLCQFHWEPGSIAFWDNRATWHSANNDYHGHRREMHRITLDGCPLTAAAVE
ncbi:MAG: TauD/TfdA family dioxygenase [Pseudomonadota bacterium]